MQMTAVFLSALSLLGLAVGSAALAQSSPAASAPDGIVWEEPQKAAPGATTGHPAAPADLDQMKSMTFRKMVLRMPDGQIIGFHHSGSCRSTSGEPITLEKGFRLMPPGAYQQMFGMAMTKAGYKTVKGNVVFDEANPEEPELYAGAAITAVDMQVCSAGSGGFLSGISIGIGGAGSVPRPRRPDGPDHYEVSVSETIVWQILDPLNNKVIASATTQGNGHDTGVYADAQLHALYGAFYDAAQQVLAMPEFRQAVMRSPDEQAALVHLTQDTTPATSIPRVPLSNEAFQMRLKDLQAHVVTVRTSLGTGSGFYIADGLLLTNHHVAAKGATVRIRFLSGKEIPGFSIASNARRDVALIRTEPVDLPGLPLHTQEPTVGSQTYAIGSPKGQDFEGTVSAGIVSAVRDYDKARWIQSDVAVTHGSSGGPLFDAHGNVLGMTDRNADKHDEPVNMNLFIPIGEALDALGVRIQGPRKQLITKASTLKKPAP